MPSFDGWRDGGSDLTFGLWDPPRAGIFNDLLVGTSERNRRDDASTV